MCYYCLYYFICWQVSQPPQPLQPPQPPQLEDRHYHHHHPQYPQAQHTGTVRAHPSATFIQPARFLNDAWNATERNQWAHVLGESPQPPPPLRQDYVHPQGRPYHNSRPSHIDTSIMPTPYSSVSPASSYRDDTSGIERGSLSRSNTPDTVSSFCW